MASERHSKAVHQMFDRTAPRYVARIDPAFEPLVNGLVAFAFSDEPPVGRILDLGTGSGLAAIASAPHAALVVGLDYSEALLQQAAVKLRSASLTHVNLVAGDMHALSLADVSFEVALGSFSLNSTDPTIVLSEVFRILRPGGLFAVQEWGTQDDLSEIIYDTTAEYSVDEPPQALAAQREAMATPDAWDELDGIEDVVGLLEAAGYTSLEVKKQVPTVHFDDIDAFLDYKLAWASRHDEIEAMPEEVRVLYFGELYDNLEPHCNEHGSLDWQPEIVRIRSRKPVR